MILADYEKIRNGENGLFTIDELEEAMQKVMDEYAGGIASNYQFNEKQLNLAEDKIQWLLPYILLRRKRSPSSFSGIS